MKKLYLLSAACLLFCSYSFSQIILTGSAYGPQNFNSLANSGTTNPLTITGWIMNETGGGTRDNDQYGADNGNSATGDTYSYGTTSTTERALGGLQSGTLIPVFGVFFTNNTGNTITSLTVSYTGEQWRLATAGRADRLDFQYSLNATSLTTGTWIDVDNLDFSSPNTTTTGMLDGNLPANQTLISFTINGLSIANGSTFYFRWNDLNVSGSDDGLAVDEFSMSYTLGGSTSASVSAGSNGTEGGANGTFNINLNNPAPTGGTTISYSLTGTATVGVSNDYTDPQSGSVTIAEGLTSAVVTMNINDDSEVEPNESITLTLTNATNGVSWSLTPATIQVLDNESTQVAYHDFATCTASLSDGYTQFSVSGAQVWGCTTFGRSGNAIQMNGFASGPQLNDDWVISPSLDLSATTVPLLNFFVRTAFAGDQLRLYVSTNYVSGDPNAGGVTWTEIDGHFPAQFSDAWTGSHSINLSAFKTTNVHFAFRYTSSTEAASRITIDDIYVLDVSAAPPPTLTTNSTLVDFRFVPFGSSSANKSYTFWANDLTTDLTITAPANFELSKDGTTFSSSILFTPAETQNSLKTVFARYTPSSANQTSSGYLTFSTTGFTHQRVFVKGNSYPPASTLNIVNWNIEWFGATGQGPGDENLQQANAETVMEFLDADIFAVAEIVDVTRFTNLVNSLGAPGSHSYVIADWCSGGTTAAACASAQKTAFVYKTSVVSNVEMRGFLRTSTNPQNADNWANGRYPMLVRANVAKNGESRTMYFMVLHAEAGDTQSDYESRLRGVAEMKDSLDAHMYFTNMVILGDFNDDLDISIYDANGPTVSSYTNLISDSTDADSYRSVTLPLSHFGLHSTFGNGDVIDHVVMSNEVAGAYVTQSATLFDDIGTLAGVANYVATTSDHFPVMTQIIMASVLPVKLTSFTATKENSTVAVKWRTSQEINSKEFIVERSKDGVNFSPIGVVTAAGSSSLPRSYQFVDRNPFNGSNFYRLRIVDKDNSFEYSPIAWVRFGGNLSISVRPNPSTDHVKILLQGSTAVAHLRLTDIGGRMIVNQQATLVDNQPYTLALSNLSKGVYLLNIQVNDEHLTERIVLK